VIRSPILIAVALLITLWAPGFGPVAGGLASSMNDGARGGAWIIVLIVLVGALLLVRSRLGRR
jgi:hypothetical protein